MRNAHQEKITTLAKNCSLKMLERNNDMHSVPFRKVLTEKFDNVAQEFILKLELAARDGLQINKPSYVYRSAAGVGEMRLVVAVGKGDEYYVIHCEHPSACLDRALRHRKTLFKR